MQIGFLSAFSLSCSEVFFYDFPPEFLWPALTEHGIILSVIMIDSALRFSFTLAHLFMSLWLPNV